jgi:transcriptional regulator with XRE-family HTH domain
MKIGDKIKFYRTKKRLNQDEIAKKAGVSRGAIVNYESNRRIPSADVAYYIADALGVSADELLSPDSPEIYDENMNLQDARQRIHQEKYAYALIDTNNPAIHRDSPVGKVVYKFEFQGFILDLLETLMQRSGDAAKIREWEIIEFLNNSLKHLNNPSFDSEDLHKIISVFDWFVHMMVSKDEETCEIMKNKLLTTLDEIRMKKQNPQNKSNTES